MSRALDYSKMQKAFYEDRSTSPENVVGNYGWHENFPYETNLLYRYADVRLPVLETAATARALDVGCGPGRMITRMKKLIGQVDGADISKRLLNEAQQRHPDSQFFETAGNDLGGAPSNSYDFVYSTIALQHVAVRSIRLNILREIRRVLKPGGAFTLQFAYLDTLPYVIQRTGRLLRYFNLARATPLAGHAGWDKDEVSATTTNGACDVTIGPNTIGLAVADFQGVFGGVEHWFYDIRVCLTDLRGHAHCPYWASHWVFFHGRKARD